MIRANLAGVMLFLAVTACAGAAKQVQAPQATKDAKPVASNDKKDIVCRMERPTGSNIPERVCRYVDLAPSEDTQRTQDMLRHEQGRSGPIQGN